MSMSEELYMFAERYAHFSNLHTIYRDLLSGHYKPSLAMNGKPGEMDMTGVPITVMLVLYAYFYSMVEDDDQSVNAFRLWREHRPEEEKAIAALESKVAPMREGLRLCRNRLVFHGSRWRAHEQRAFELFEQHSGNNVWETMGSFKSLGAALFRKDLDQQNGADPARTRKWIDELTRRCGGNEPDGGDTQSAGARPDA